MATLSTRVHQAFPRRSDETDAGHPDAAAGAGSGDAMRYQVIERRTHTHDVVTLTLRPNSTTVVPLFRPGQFAVLGRPGPTAVTSMVSGRLDPGGLQFTIRAADGAGTALCRAVPGSTIAVTGPLGAGWPLPAPLHADVVLVASGLGLAPLRPLIHHIAADRRRYHRVTLFLGGRTPEDLLFSDEYASWVDQGIGIFAMVDQQRAGTAGWINGVNGLLGNGPRTARASVAYVCGPELLLRPAGRGLVAHGVPADRIWLSLTRPRDPGVDPIVCFDRLAEPIR